MGTTQRVLLVAIMAVMAWRIARTVYWLLTDPQMRRSAEADRIGTQAIGTAGLWASPRSRSLLLAVLCLVVGFLAGAAFG